MGGDPEVFVDSFDRVDATGPTDERRQPHLREDAGDLAVALGVGTDRAGDDRRHDLADPFDDVGVLVAGRAEGAHHRDGDVGVAAQRGVGAAQHRGHPLGRGRAFGRVPAQVPAQVVLLLDHHLEQQPLLRVEVAVDGADRDVRLGRDVTHLHAVEAAVAGEHHRRVEHPPPAGRLAARQRTVTLDRCAGGLGGVSDHAGIETRSLPGGQPHPVCRRDDAEHADRRFEDPRHRRLLGNRRSAGARAGGRGATVGMVARRAERLAEVQAECAARGSAPPRCGPATSATSTRPGASPPRCSPVGPGRLPGEQRRDPRARARHAAHDGRGHRDDARELPLPRRADPRVAAALARPRSRTVVNVSSMGGRVADRQRVGVQHVEVHARGLERGATHRPRGHRRGRETRAARPDRHRDLGPARQRGPLSRSTRCRRRNAAAEIADAIAGDGFEYYTPPIFPGGLDAKQMVVDKTANCDGYLAGMAAFAASLRS